MRQEEEQKRLEQEQLERARQEKALAEQKAYEEALRREKEAYARRSGVHFTMLWDGRGVYVWDSQSKNGTSVNGVVVNHLGKVAVRPGDSLRAGSYEYRLYWED